MNSVPDMLQIVQFNLLAPLWVSKLYQQLPCYAEFKDPKRYNRAVRYLRDCLPEASIYCLSEVTLEAVTNLIKIFPEYDGFFVPNDQSYWREWLAEDYKESIPNGVAVLTDPAKIKVVKRVDFLYGNGGHAAIIEGVLLKTSQTLRIVSLHLNVTKSIDDISIRKLLAYLDSQTRVDISLISGDFNTPNIEAFTRKGYIESMADPNINTSPLKLGSAGKIDHTLLLSKSCVHISKIFRITNYREDIASRFCDTVRFNGSDHYATTTKILF